MINTEFIIKRFLTKTTDYKKPTADVFIGRFLCFAYTIITGQTRQAHREPRPLCLFLSSYDTLETIHNTTSPVR
jgi:hypothetical protein